MKFTKCHCSRCRLYLRADSDFDYNEYEMKTQIFEHREYQHYLLDMAKKENIIACLPTGSGKTFIAYKLIEHFNEDLLTKNKKVFFLANTIPLVNQQAAFFARHTVLQIRHITGDMEVDYWSEEKWTNIIKEFHVMAMTVQIFLNLVRHGYIQFSQIALIVFDECHHAVKEHEMNQIMREYHRTKNSDEKYPLPRILGLSATIIKGHCKPDDVPDRVRELEHTMDSIAVTYKDYEEVMKNSTNARTEPISFSNDKSYEWYPSGLQEELDDISKRLKLFRKERKKQKTALAKVPIEGIHSTLRNANNLYLTFKSPSPGDLKTAVDDVRHAYEVLGPYCAVIAINLRLAFIEFSLMDLCAGTIKKCYQDVKEFFHKMRTILSEVMAGAKEDEKITTFISPKLKQLIKIICQFRDAEQSEIGEEDLREDERLCGLIFVDRRATAQILAWYLKDLASSSPASSDTFSFIRADFVVGTSRCPFETVESRIYAKKQTETINKFRNRTFNILVATCVLEEGIDVPSCNLVVRFDPIPTYTSFIQSMGRARRKDALFKIFINPEVYSKEQQKIDTFKKIHKRLVEHLQQVRKVDSDFDAKGTKFLVDEVAPLCPGGTADSPRITMDSAFEVIDRYCMLLPCDGVSTLHTVSWFNILPDSKFQAYLKLPMNSVVKEAIPGLPMINKELARQAAFLEGAKRLHAAGILDEKLIPGHPTFPAYVEAFFNILTPMVPKEDEDKEDGEIRERKPEWYSKKGSRILSRIEESSNIYHLAHFWVRSANIIGHTEQNVLYRLNETQYSFGILSAEQILNIGDFPLYGAFGTLNVSIEYVRNYKMEDMSSRLLDQIKNLQDQLFRDVLGLQHGLFRRNKKSNFWIVPLIKDTDNWNIYERILDSSGDVHINPLFNCQNLRPPRKNYRPSQPKIPKKDGKDYDEKYKDRIVIPWYKPKPRPLYFVDAVAHDMSPLSQFHDGLHSNYKNFIKTTFKVDIEDINQPLLKCKVAGIGKGQKQLNYLIKKYSKEDEFPVYLVPELCYILPVPASLIVQLKLLPSILHRLDRLMLAKEIMDDVAVLCAWKGAHQSFNANNEKEILALTRTQEKESAIQEERRQMRIEMRKRIKPIDKPIQDSKNLENRDLHYEFIHPNKITNIDIKLFHEAVSIQHAAKKLTITNDVQIIEDGNELSPACKIELMEPSDVETCLPKVDISLNLEEDKGPSLIAIMEAISLRNSNEGISSNDHKVIGMSFLNYSVSSCCYFNFPNWSEPLLCQLRNRLLSIQSLCAFAKNRGIAEFLSGSYFYPNDTWIPPGIKLQDGLGDLASAAKVHLGVYNKIVKDIMNMNPKDLEKYVISEAPSVLAAESEKGKYIIKHSTYTHSEVTDFGIANGVNALVGAFFVQCGPIGAFKCLEWIKFKCPDLHGNDLYLHETGPTSSIPSVAERSAIEILLPGLKKFEESINYSFIDKRLILEAFTHPTYPANNVSGCYQRLEFLGDSILDLLITNYVYTSADRKLSEEQLKDICLALSNNITYASLAVRYGFNKHLLSMSQALVDMIDNFVVYQEAIDHRVIGHFTLISDEECWGPKHVEVPKVLGDIFEAVAGAIYLDSNKSLDTVWSVYFRLMQNEIDNFLEDIPKSPLHDLKSKFGDQLLLQKCTSKKIRARGREMCKISVPDYGHYFGCGTNITRAKFSAAKIALKMMKEEDAFIKDRDCTQIMLLA